MFKFFSLDINILAAGEAVCMYLLINPLQLYKTLEYFPNILLFY